MSGVRSSGLPLPPVLVQLTRLRPSWRGDFGGGQGCQMALFGGGFVAAFLQLSVFYYAVAFILHTVIPTFVHPEPLQKERRGNGEALRDALRSVGPIGVKAAIWTVVENLHARGYGLMYEDLPG